MEPNRPDINPEEMPVERVEVPSAPSGPSSVNAVPSQVSVTPAEGNLAAQYISNELKQFRTSLQRTQVIGSLLVLALLGYMGYMAYNFKKNLEPQAAAQFASYTIGERVNEQAEDLAAQMKERIPALIEGLPDQAMKQLPQYRQQLESQIDTDLREHSKAAAENLSTTLDDYLTQHKDEMKAVLDSGNDSAAVKQMGGEIEKQFIESLQKTQAGGGENLKTKLDKTLQSLKEVDVLMKRLADNKNLTPQEKKARRAIAILTEKINVNAPAAKAFVNDLKDTANQTVKSVTDSVASSVPAVGATNDATSTDTAPTNTASGSNP